MNSTESIKEPAPIEQPLKGIARKIAEARERHRLEIELLLKVASIIDVLPEDIAEKCEVYDTQIDIDNLTHKQVVEVMGILHAGKWIKTVNPWTPDLLDYETTIDGMVIRLGGAGPPESCRVIETEEIIPATKIIHRRLICSEKEVL